MFLEKIITVGRGGEYLTLKEAFKHHKRGKLHVILTSDVFDEQDISVPRSLKALRVTTKNEDAVGFSNKHMTIYCNGVRSVFEDIGKKELDLVVIGTEHNVRDVSILLKRCHVDYIIGSHSVKKVNHLHLRIEESELNTVLGFLNYNQSLTCKSMIIDIESTKLNILHAVNLTNEKGEVSASLGKGVVSIKDSFIEEIKLSRGTTIKDEESLMELTIAGNSLVTKGIS